MAKIVIQRIEKDFYLNELFDRRIPLRFRFNRQEYTLMVVNNWKGRLCLQANRPVTGLRPGGRLDLLFDFHGKKVQFTVKVESIRGNLITAAGEVDFLRRELERSFTRVAPPPDLRAALVFQEERYALGFPRINSYEPVRMSPVMADRGIKDMQAAVQGLYSWARGVADGRQAVVFSKVKPRRLEERLVAGTGLMLYIPSSMEGLSKKYPDPDGRVMTEQRFLNGLMRLGYKPAEAGGMLVSFIKSKIARGVYSELWAPIRFQEYVLGYVRLWTVREGKPPLNYQAVETALEFTKGIACAFKEGGRLESLRAPNEPFEGRVIDISASGLLFSYPPSKPGLSLPPGLELGATLETPGRTVKTGLRIVRRVVSGGMSGQFLALQAEDQHFLFEYLYGEPFAANKNPFLAGQV
ncbi:MAG: PilZ domain-containing protein [Treponema sp.]|jgi:hypothetical protein|nr:PilZ domain-containing protein [Treponema sp.]